MKLIGLFILDYFDNRLIQLHFRWRVSKRRTTTTRLTHSVLPITSLMKGDWLIDLAVGIDHWSQQFPGSSSSVHSNHPEDLKKSKRPDGGRGEDISLSPRSQHRDGRYQHHDVCRRTSRQQTGHFILDVPLNVNRLIHDVLRLTDDTEWFPGKFESSSPSSVPTATACSPDPHHVLHPKHHDGHHLLLQHKHHTHNQLHYMLFISDPTLGKLDTSEKS